jgi:hypothetical protein
MAEQEKTMKTLRTFEKDQLDDNDDNALGAGSYDKDIIEKVKETSLRSKKNEETIEDLKEENGDLGE